MLETREIYTNDLARTIIAAVQTDPGCVREANEDSGRHINPNDKEVRNGKGTLTIVADGMGGHASGEVASQMAVDIISELYYSDHGLTPPEALRLVGQPLIDRHRRRAVNDHVTKQRDHVK